MRGDGVGDNSSRDHVHMPLCDCTRDAGSSPWRQPEALARAVTAVAQGAPRRRGAPRHPAAAATGELPSAGSSMISLELRLFKFPSICTVPVQSQAIQNEAVGQVGQPSAPDHYR